MAQEALPPTSAPDEGAMPANTPVTPAQPASTSQTPDNSQNQTQNNSQSQDASQTGTQGTPSANGTQSQVVPLLPQPGTGPYPFSSSATEPQSSQITSPSLYNTGAYDLSQVATTSALLQAFSQQVGTGFLSEGGAGYSYGPIQRIRLGPFDLKFALATTVVSDDNILAGESNGNQRISDTSLGVTPAVMVEYGNHEGQKGTMSLVYSPTLLRYFKDSSQNADDQNVSFSAGYSFQRLNVDLSEAYSQVTGVNNDSNVRTTETSSVSTIGGSYDIDDKLSLVSHLQELDTQYSQAGGQGDDTTSLNNSITYHLSDKMTLGPSANFGYERPQGSPNQTFEQGLLGLNYQPTAKIGLYGQAGAEFTQFNGGGDQSDPIFSAGIKYTPFDSTSLSLNGFQNVQPSSADSQQTAVNTGVGASITQRFFQRFFVGFSFDYEDSEYSTNSGGSTAQATAADNAFGNKQQNFVYRPSLTYAPTEWTSLAVYYQYRANESDSTTGGYHDNQLGVSVSAQF